MNNSNLLLQPTFLKVYWYNKCTGFLTMKLETVHFYRFWRPQMYKSQVNTQLSFEDFNQPIGLTMNPENRWIKEADQIPWVALEKDYAKNFRNNKGNIAKPLRMALGALLIQMFYSWSDEEVVQSIQENPYLQFFIGLPGYQQ